MAKIAETPSMNDEAPQGTGPANRHGMPRLPIGQFETKKWPVLDLGERPVIPLDRWKLTLDGAVAEPTTLEWKHFKDLEQVVDVQDFHCVTTWSRFDLEFVGVRFSTIAALCQPSEDATHIFCHGSDGYTTNLPMIEAMKNDVLLVHQANGEALSVEHGGPVRMVTPQLYAWKGAKWINRIEFLTQDRLGYWEQRGYSNTAYPWRDDRYS